MMELFLFFRGVATGLLLLLGLKIWLDYRGLLSGRLLLAVLGGVAAYCVAPFLDSWPWLKHPAVIAAILVPALFWLLCLAVFQDWDHRQQSISRLQLGVVLLFLLIAYGSFLLQGEQRQPADIVPWALLYLAYLFRIVFMGLSLAAIVGQSRFDLVEARRQLRTVLLAAGGAYILAVICAEMLLGGAAAPLWLEVGHSLLMVLFLTLMSVWMLVVSPRDVLGPRRPESAPKSLSATEQGWLNALQQHMDQQHGYRTPDLTIRHLGEQLAIPEHQLRRLINQHLDYRNFSDYLNRFRIDEASRRLADPQQERLPVLTIALDVGFASLTPFNRAFKSRHQLTPTAYRRQHQESQARPPSEKGDNP